MRRVSRTAIVLGAVIFLGGCGADQYTMERDYYRLQKQAAAIFNNPAGTPPAGVEKVVSSLTKVSLKHPKSRVSVDADFTIARLYAATKEFTKAHQQLSKLDTDYRQSAVIRAETAFMRGEVYEAQNNWKDALRQYQAVSRDFPLTPKGMEAPMVLAAKYKKKLQPDNMMEALRQAVTHYDQLARAKPDSPLALQCRMLIARCQIELKEPARAIETLEKVLRDFEGKVRSESVMLEIANIYYVHLKDSANASVLLNKIVEKHSNTREAVAAKSALTRIAKESK